MNKKNRQLDFLKRKIASKQRELADHDSKERPELSPHKSKAVKGHQQRDPLEGSPE